MGIDARILVRYRGERPSSEQLARWSFALVDSLGDGQNFYLDSDPRRPRRAIDLTEDYFEEDGYIPESHRGPGRVSIFDGPPIFAEPGEWLLDVGVWTRYYEVGYERGDILFLCSVAEWIEANIPNAEVWYGGDSSGCVASPFPEARRLELRRHLYSPEGRAYFRYRQGPLATPPFPPPCVLCIPGEPRFSMLGQRGACTTQECGGCQRVFETHDNGTSWQKVAPPK